MVDFLVECAWLDKKLDERPTEQLDPDAPNFQGSGARLLLTNLEGVVTKYALHFSFKATNNQAEYETLLAMLKISKERRKNPMDIHRLIASSRSSNW